MKHKYVHIVDADGYRVTSIDNPIDSKIDEYVYTDEELLQQAKEKYPDEAFYICEGDAFLDSFLSGNVYKGGTFAPPAPVEISLDDLKAEKIAAAGATFAAKRDAHTWREFDGVRYGYDRTAEDIPNFLAALERAKLGANVYYKVYIGAAETKGLKPHTLEMFYAVLEQSAEEQTAAYLEYESVKVRILACETKAELDAIEV